MSELVDRAKASLEDTTPGLWQVVGYGNIQPETVGEYPPIGKIYGKGNQQFIVASRQLIPELIAEVERLEARLRIHHTWNPAWGSPYDVMGDVL